MKSWWPTPIPRLLSPSAPFPWKATWRSSCSSRWWSSGESHEGPYRSGRSIDTNRETHKGARCRRAAASRRGRRGSRGLSSGGWFPFQTGERALLVGHFEQLVIFRRPSTPAARPFAAQPFSKSPRSASAPRDAAARSPFEKTAAASSRAAPSVPAAAPPWFWGTLHSRAVLVPAASAASAPVSSVRWKRSAGLYVASWCWRMCFRARVLLASLWNVEQRRDDFARARFFLREWGQLPFAEGKQRRLRQREIETRVAKSKLPPWPGRCATRWTKSNEVERNAGEVWENFRTVSADEQMLNE